MSDLRTEVQKLADRYRAETGRLVELCRDSDDGDPGLDAAVDVYREIRDDLDGVLVAYMKSEAVATLLPEDYERSGPISGALVEYRIADGPWQHGWSLWQHEATDEATVAHCRKVVRERHAEPGVTVRTRVRFYSEED